MHRSGGFAWMRYNIIAGGKLHLHFCVADDFVLETCMSAAKLLIFPLNFLLWNSGLTPKSSMTVQKVEHLSYDARFCNYTVTSRCFSGPDRKSLQRCFLFVQPSLFFTLRLIKLVSHRRSKQISPPCATTDKKCWHFVSAEF